MQQLITCLIILPQAVCPESPMFITPYLLLFSPVLSSTLYYSHDYHCYNFHFFFLSTTFVLWMYNKVLVLNVWFLEKQLVLLFCKSQYLQTQVKGNIETSKKTNLSVSLRSRL